MKDKELKAIIEDLEQFFSEFNLKITQWRYSEETASLRGALTVISLDQTAVIHVIELSYDEFVKTKESLEGSKMIVTKSLIFEIRLPM